MADEPPPVSRLGPYQVLGHLGSGGMGAVYRALDPRLGREVAIKLLPAHSVGDPQREMRFQQEARAAGALNHPNILAIYDVNTAGETPYIVSERIEGRSLREELHRAGRMSVKKLLDVAAQIADGLSAAHQVGIVHRDLKPENIMLTHQGRIKILDFGLAAQTVPSSSAMPPGTITATAPGTILGTAPYMSPEQARGVSADHRSDQFSFGAILYELATGRHAFRRETAVQTLSAVIDQEPEPIVALAPQVPPPLQWVIERCLSKDPERRYESTTDLYHELLTLRERGLGAGTVATARTWMRVSIAAGFAALLAASFMLSHFGSRHPLAPKQSLTRLTTDPGLQTEPTWSPDGRFIAYSSDRSGNFDIWVQPVMGGEAVQVTKDPAHDWQPDWSPNGSQIVFRSERQGGGLFLAAALGGDERKLTSFGYRPRWSPDGRQIVLAGSALEDLAEAPRMYVVRLDGNRPRPILEEFLAQFRSRPAVAWHPDGLRLSFWGYRRNENGASFWTVAVEGGTPVRSELDPAVTEGMAEASLESRRGHFAWAPSGRMLVFVGISREIRNLWKVVVDPSTLRWTAGPERLTAGPGADSDLVLSRDGTRIAFGTATRNSQIWTFSFDAAAGRMLGDGQPLTGQESNSFAPDMTRDGRSLIFETEQPGRLHRHRLVERSLLEGRERRLVESDIENGEDRFMPRWSPDGTRIAYRFRAAHPGLLGSCSIRILDAVSGQERDVTSPRRDCDEIATHWTADGRWILATGRRYAPGRAAIALLPVSAAPHAENEALIVTSDTAHELLQATISPDDRWIAFTAVSHADASASTVYVVRRTGGAWSQITDGASWDDKPRWSPDGRTLYFVSSRRGFFNVWGVHFDPARGGTSGEASPVTAFDGPRRMILPSSDLMDMAVGHDALLLTMRDETGGIWMMEGVNR